MRIVLILLFILPAFAEEIPGLTPSFEQQGQKTIVHFQVPLEKFPELVDYLEYNPILPFHIQDASGNFCQGHIRYLSPNPLSLTGVIEQACPLPADHTQIQLMLN